MEKREKEKGQKKKNQGLCEISEFNNKKDQDVSNG